MLSEYLTKRGFRVLTAGDAAGMRAQMASGDVALILLDINMPGEDGLSALRGLRASDTTPVVMLTAAGDVVDRIVGLEMGADDYLGKPVDLRELEARIKAVLRRRAAEAPAPAAASGQRLAHRSLRRLHARPRRGQAARRGRQEVPLTAMEFSLLKVFAENRRRVLNRDQILEKAHDRAWDPFDRSIDIRISRIRRKIEPNPQKPQIIRTVRGIGYIYDPE